MTGLQTFEKKLHCGASPPQPTMATTPWAVTATSAIRSSKVRGKRVIAILASPRPDGSMPEEDASRLLRDDLMHGLCGMNTVPEDVRVGLGALERWLVGRDAGVGRVHEAIGARICHDL